DDTHLKLQPIRFLKASSLASGARETATIVTSRAARCGSAPSIWSDINEQLGQPSCQSGPNMKWYITSWLRPEKRSVNGILPPGASKKYLSLTRTQGSLRRSAFNPSRSRVSSFSFLSSSLRSEIHCSGETIGCSEIAFLPSEAIVVVLIFGLSSWLIVLTNR